MLGQAPIKMKPVEWHALRVQRNTIISKDFIECFFDGQLALSVEDQTLGVGQVGLVMRGETGVQFDNFNAAPSIRAVRCRRRRLIEATGTLVLALISVLRLLDH